MKFFEILQGKKANVEEVAGAIVDLENRLPEFEKAMQSTEKEAIKLRQMRIGGASVSDSEIKNANVKLESSRLDLEAAKTSVDELRAKLTSLIEAQREKENLEIEKAKKQLDLLKQEARKKLAEAAAVVQAILIRLEYSEQHFPNHAEGTSDMNLKEVTFFQKTEEHAVFIEETRRQLEKMDKELGPSIYQREGEIAHRESTFKNGSVESTFEELLNKARGDNS